MAEKIRAIRGMNDILPHQTAAWRRLEEIFSSCLLQYGYQEIRLTDLSKMRSLLSSTEASAVDLEH